MFFCGQYCNTFSKNRAFYKDGFTFYIELPRKGFSSGRRPWCQMTWEQITVTGWVNQVHLAS